jgi:hypothetical protein
VSRHASEIQTYVLLLRELVDGTCHAVVIYGRGLVDGLSTAAFFAGWCRGKGEFPGGIYLMATTLSDLKERFDCLCGRKAERKKLIIIDDRRFPEHYSLNTSELLAGRTDVSLIVAARGKTGITGEHTAIDVSEDDAEVMDLFTLLLRTDAVDPDGGDRPHTPSALN